MSDFLGNMACCLNWSLANSFKDFRLRPCKYIAVVVQLERWPPSELTCVLIPFPFSLQIVSCLLSLLSKKSGKSHKNKLIWWSHTEMSSQRVEGCRQGVGERCDDCSICSVSFHLLGRIDLRSVVTTACIWWGSEQRTRALTHVSPKTASAKPKPPPCCRSTVRHACMHSQPFTCVSSQHTSQRSEMIFLASCICCCSSPLNRPHRSHLNLSGAISLICVKSHGRVYKLLCCCLNVSSVLPSELLHYIRSWH